MIRNSRSISVKRDDIWGKIIFFLIILMPFVRYYNVPFTGMGSNSFLSLLLMFLTIGVSFAGKRHKYRLTTAQRSSRGYYLSFLLWATLITLYYEYNGLVSGSFNNAIIAFFTGIVMLMLLSGRIRFSNVFIVYEKLVYVVLLVLGIQWILSMGGKSYDFHLPLHEYNGSWKFNEMMVFGMDGVNTSLFSEPAHLSEFLFPYLCISLFIPSFHRKWNWMTLLVSLAILGTMSGTGIVVVAIIWTIYFTFYRNNGGKRNPLIGIIGIILLVVAYFVLSAMEDYNNVFGKLFVSQNGSLEGNKASFRIYRGWSYVFQMPFPEILTGVGFVHMEPFTMQKGIRSIFDNDFKIFEWFSAITEVILYFGIIGFVPFVMHIVNLYKRQSILTKTLLVIFIALCFTSQILFLETHVFYIAIIVASIQLYDEERKAVLR